MFPGGMPDLTQIVLRAQQMQADVERAQASLAESEVTGSAGGGLVTATVTGAGELVGLTLAPEVVDPQDTETLADLVIAAVRDANRRAQEMSSETMGAVTGGLAESFDLSSFGLGGLGGFGAPGAPSGLDELDELEGDELEDDEVDSDEVAGQVVDGDELDGLPAASGDATAAVYQDGAEVPDRPVVVDEAALIEAGQPTDQDPTDTGPADRAAPGRS